MHACVASASQPARHVVGHIGGLSPVDIPRQQSSREPAIQRRPAFLAASFLTSSSRFGLSLSCMCYLTGTVSCFTWSPSPFLVLECFFSCYNGVARKAGPQPSALAVLAAMFERQPIHHLLHSCARARAKTGRDLHASRGASGINTSLYCL